MPPHFSKVKQQVPLPPGQCLHNNPNNGDEPTIPEDVYDIPPPILTDKHFHSDQSRVSQAPTEIYDIPATLRTGGHPIQDVYDFPREQEEKGGERREHYVYDIPPQVGELKGQPHILGKILDLLSCLCFQCREKCSFCLVSFILVSCLKTSSPFAQLLSFLFLLKAHVKKRFPTFCILRPMLSKKNSENNLPKYRNII